MIFNLSKYKSYFQNKLNKIGRLPLPGDNSVTLGDTVAFMWTALQSSEFSVRAGAMAFNFFFALFPGLIFLITLVPLMPIDNLQREVLLFMRQYLPDEGFQLVYDTLTITMEENRSSLLSISFFLVAFSATRGILVMMYTFDRNEAGFTRRSVVRARLLAMGMVWLLTIFFLMALSVVITAEVWMGYLNLENTPLPHIGAAAIRIADTFMTFGVLWVAFAIIYHFIPSREKRWKFFSPGALLGSFLALIATIAFGLFMANFGNYNKIYGTLSAVMVLMVWMFWISNVILIGFEFNVAIEKAKLSSIKD